MVLLDWVTRSDDGSPLVIGDPASDSWRTWRTKYAATRVLVDLVAVIAAVAIASALTLPAGLRVTAWQPHQMWLALLSMAGWMALLASAGSYRRSLPVDGGPDYRAVAVAAVRLASIGAVLAVVTHDTIQRDRFAAFFVALVPAGLLGRAVARRILVLARRRGRALNTVVLAGDAASVQRFSAHVRRHPDSGYEVVGACVNYSSPEDFSLLGSLPVFGRADNIVTEAHRMGADTVAVVGHGGFADTTLQQVAWELERSGIGLLVAPDVVELAGPRIKVAPVLGLPLLHISEPRVGGVGQAVKATYERSLAALALLVTLPVLAVAALAVRLDSPGPVFFLQERIGRNGKPFRMVKFRSMVHGADAMKAALLATNENDGALFKMRQDPRITRVGRLLRKYSIDELPQLWNVVCGNMMLIGPRPCLAAETEQFSLAAHRRFLVRPGLTGLWQVSGRSDLPYEEAVRLDLYYVENWSPLMDIKILLRTVRVVLQGSGAY